LSTVEVAGSEIASITVPAEWTPANLSFQVSNDGEAFADLYLADGNEVILPARAGGIIPWRSREWPAHLFIRFRSGSSWSPVPQAARREFAVAIVN
jgi:hypothetical protein